MEKVALKDRACTEDDDRRITAIYHSLWVSLCLLYFLCTLHELSLQIASLAWHEVIIARLHQYKLHTFSSFLCCSTHQICVQQHNMKKTCVTCTDVVWLRSPATIALSVLRANEATCKLTTWDILILVKVLFVIWCVLIN